MKIFEVIPQLSQGGAERFVLDLSNNLSKANDVTLIVFHSIDDNAFLLNELSPEVKLIVLNKNKGIDLSVVYKLIRLIRKHKPDVVHSHLRSILYLSFPSLFFSKVKFIHTVHSDAQTEAGRGLSLFLRRRLFRKKFTPITISKTSQKSFDDFYGYDNVLIYNGSVPYVRSQKYASTSEQLSQLRITPSTKIILNVARVNRYKNQLSLVKAVADIRESGEDLQLVIIGDLQDSEITAEIMKYGYSFVHLLGAKENPRDYMDLADCFCLSSIYEGMPLSLIECFSVGCVPVCTPVGGILDVIDDSVNGILAEGIETSDVQTALRRFLAMSPQQINDMQRASRDTYNKFSMQTCSDRYEQLMKKMCSK